MDLSTALREPTNRATTFSRQWTGRTYQAGRLMPLAIAAMLLATGCAQAPKPSVDPKEVGEARPGSGYLNGYVARTDMPDSLALLPPPPEKGSAAFEADVQAYKTLTALQSSQRGK